MLRRRDRDVAVRRPAGHVGDVGEALVSRDVVAVAAHHGRAHGHAVEGVGLGQNDAAPGVEPRHGDAAFRRLGAGGQNAQPAGPALLPQDVLDHQLRGAGAILVRHRVSDVAVALHGLGQRTVDRRMPVTQVVRDQLAHEVEQPRAVGKREIVAVGAVDRRDAEFVLGLKAVQVVGPVPALELVPIACHDTLPEAGHETLSG